MRTILLLLLFHNPLFAKTITITFMSDHEPVAFLSPKSGEIVGIEPDIIREALAEEKNIELKFVGLPWGRVQDRVKKGQADAFIAVITPERLVFSYPSKVAFFPEGYTIFTYAKNPKIDEMKKIKTINDLQNYTVCEYSESGWARRNLPGKVKKIDYAKSVDMKVTMLAAKRCDLIIDLDFLVNSVAKQHGVSESIVELPIILKGTSYHLMIGKQSENKKILNKVSDKLKSMHESGRINQIIQKWTFNSESK